MNTNTRCIRLFVALALLLSALSVTLRTISCMRDLEYINGYFNSKSLMISGATALAVGCIALFSYTFFASKMSVKPSFSSPKTYVPTGAVAIALIFSAVSLLSKIGKPEAGKNTYVIFVTAVLALLSIVHFFLNAYLTESKTTLRAYFSLFTVAYLAMYAAFLYFDTSLPLNATNKLVDQIAYLFAALFFLYESRISLGRELWRGYVAFGLIAAMTTAYSSIPSLAVYMIKGYIISNSIEESLLTFTLFLFIISRLTLTSSLYEMKENKFIHAMQTYADKREGVVIESAKVHREAFSPQMTIDDLLDQPGDFLPLYEKESEPASEEAVECVDDNTQIEMIDLFDAIGDEAGIFTEEISLEHESWDKEETAEEDEE